MPEPGKTKAGLAPFPPGLFAFLLCFLLAKAAPDQSPFRYEPKAVGRLEPRSFGNPVAMRIASAAAVMPFADAAVTRTDAPGPARQAPPEPVRREAAEQGPCLVCQLGAKAKLFGVVDGRALARGWAEYVGRTGLVFRASYVEAPREITDERVLFEGRVLKAEMRVAENGARDYLVEVEMSASFLDDGYPPVRPPFWRQAVRAARRGGARPAAYEINDLLNELFAEAAKGLAAMM